MKIKAEISLDAVLKVCPFGLHFWFLILFHKHLLRCLIHLILQFRMFKFSVWGLMPAWVFVFVDNLHRIFCRSINIPDTANLLPTFTREKAVLMLDWSGRIIKMCIIRDMWVPPVKNVYFDIQERILGDVFVTQMTSVVFLAAGSLQMARINQCKC